MVDHTELNMIASVRRLPGALPHWRFGHGVRADQPSRATSTASQKIYELVINNDPCYAYLLRGNSMPSTEKKLVMAHVYGHCDFFKNNAWFAPHEPARWSIRCSNHATRSRSEAHADAARDSRTGWRTFLDSCL